ncbi:DUF2079 domain-containing protein [Kineococcus gynurae]|uniref:DUF2079 domain-containing protein n=1 Tax=Kineococcus gynurae TaxID=452979 RepID=A0ABV5LTY7_9ACTN
MTARSTSSPPPGPTPSGPPQPPTRARRTVVLAVVGGVVAFVVLLAIGVGQWNRGAASAYDLAIFSQSAQSWAGFRLPVADVLEPGRPLLGDHFSPAVAVFALAWWVHPTPVSLVVLQALLLALGTAVVGRTAARHLPVVPAAAVTLGAVVAHGALAAARFDVHEIAIAVPLLALVAAALLERRPAAAFWWSIPLLTVKEDLGATVAAVALVLWAQRERRRAVVLAVTAVAGVLVALAIMWAVDPDHDLSRLAYFGGTGSATADPVSGWAAVGPRLGLLVATVCGGGLLWIASPIAVLAVPTLAWRLVGSQPSYWSTGFHYGAVLVPVAAIALVDVLGRARSERARTPLALGAAALTAVTTLVVLDVRSLPSPFAASTWTPSTRVEELRALAATLPAGAAVAADNSTAAYLVADHQVFGFSPGRTPEEYRDLGVQVVVLDLSRNSLKITPTEKEAWAAAVPTEGGYGSRLTVGPFTAVPLGAD